ncbi:DEAD/DEAH box helicase [Catelliglobosispora koreensis]|uniref:DEAD/DEAH box helicase n=1 Tax=Catelliglobosispora koreensis TaxID=129052 RepID=UPI00036B6836|nr:DEAD/DEAH box helicase [Catelliglobosispora koreensis]
MQVVHCFWRDGRLALWAEDSELPTRPSGRQHPFAVAVPGGAPDTVTLHLPTRNGRPVDSPELIRLAEPESGKLTLEPWEVPITWHATFPSTLLARAPGSPDDAPARARRTSASATGDAFSADSTALTSRAFVLSASVRHHLALRAFAEDLVSRGRVLPTVVSTSDIPEMSSEETARTEAGTGTARKRAALEDGKHEPAQEVVAVWRGVLTGADAAWAQALARAEPPIARAVDGEPTVEEQLNALVDFTVTERLKKAKVDGQAWLLRLPQDVKLLQDELAHWQRDAQGSPARACFRLVEPAEETEQWHVKFALQTPTEMIPASRVWKAAKLPAHVRSPKQTLLAELGRAYRLWPTLEDSLSTRKPIEMELDAAGAHHFLKEAAPLLHSAGFGVLLPKWWGKPQSRLGVKLKAKTAKTAPGTVATKSGLGSLVDFSWEVSLGDKQLTPDELEALADLKSPLVKLHGHWVELDAKRLENGLRLLREGGQMSLAELLYAELSTEDGPLGLPVTEVTAQGALGDLLSGKAALSLKDPPDEFVGQLRPYQQRGLSWMTFLQSLGLGGILADDMGLGKTVQLLALMANPENGPTLLVCPTSLVGNWEREAARFAPKLSVHVHHGAKRSLKKADLVITTYALAARDLALLKKTSWQRIVLDEAQAIKNAATRQAVAVRSIPAAHRLAVTGTPVENRLADLWSLMEFANPGLLGPAASFKKSYGVPIERHGDEPTAERLKKITGPFILRRLKTDKTIISDLPDKLEMEILCNLTAEQASLYQAVVDDMLEKIETSDGMERRGLVLATMTKLKQICNHPAHFLRDGSPLGERSGKLARLSSIVEEVLAAGEKALLFTQYAEFGGMLRSHLSAEFGREVLYLHGAVSRDERSSLVRQFQEGTAPLFVLSLKAGGTGLTLTEANHVIHVDRWWNPAVEDQATDRAFRIGQKRNVQVRKFVCAGTVEEKIAAMIADKRGLAARIVGTGEPAFSELSNDDLRSLFSLDPGAVA